MANFRVTEKSEQASGEIVVYQPDEITRLEVRLQDETVWLTQMQIATIFNVGRPAVTKHINNIYNCGELDESSTCSILEHMGNDGRQNYQVKYFNLDVILSVGYRINSKTAIAFRRWASRVLKEYLIRGYSINSRLNQIEDKIDRRLAEQDMRIKDHEKKIDFFVRTSLPPVDVHTFSKSHDRFLIIDDAVYLIGASIKDLGKKWFGFTLMENTDADKLLERLNY